MYKDDAELVGASCVGRPMLPTALSSNPGQLRLRSSCKVKRIDGLMRLELRSKGGWWLDLHSDASAASKPCWAVKY